MVSTTVACLDARFTLKYPETGPVPPFHLQEPLRQRWISISNTHESRSAAINERMVPATSQYKPLPPKKTSTKGRIVSALNIRLEAKVNRTSVTGKYA